MIQKDEPDQKQRLNICMVYLLESNYLQVCDFLFPSVGGVEVKEISFNTRPTSFSYPVT
jgi:hypothetical protein